MAIRHIFTLDQHAWHIEPPTLASQVRGTGCRIETVGMVNARARLKAPRHAERLHHAGGDRTHSTPARTNAAPKRIDLLFGDREPPCSSPNFASTGDGPMLS